VVDGRDGGRFFGGDADVDVRDVMTVGASVVTASPDTTLKEVAELMLEHGISGLPVVDEERRVLGVVTEADIIRGETAGTGTQGMIARARALGDTAAVAIPRTAGEAMSAPAITIGPDEPVARATHLIAERGVNRLPVVDDDALLIGIIARADVVRAFAQPDEEIADTVRNELERVLGLGPGTVQVSVTGGEVALSGEVDTDVNARLAAFFASLLPGVVAVRSDLKAAENRDDSGGRADSSSTV
jgi:CBS domain-containing protein